MFELVNKFLAKKDPYNEKSWITMPVHRSAIEHVEHILQELINSKLCPPAVKDEMAYYLLHVAPLTQPELRSVRIFLFDIDYY